MPVDWSMLMFYSFQSFPAYQVANASEQLSADLILTSANKNSRRRWISKQTFLLSVLKLINWMSAFYLVEASATDHPWLYDMACIFALQ